MIVSLQMQVGLVLDGVEVNRTIIGGPAYTSKRFAKGDVLLAVDGEAVTEQTVEILLVGNDKPGSPVNIMVDKGGLKVLSFVNICLNLVHDIFFSGHYHRSPID